MRVAMAHLVQNPSLAASVADLEAFEGCDIAGFEIWRELVDFCAESPNMTTAQLLELWHEHPAHSHLAKLATWQLPGAEDRLTAEFRDAVTRIELQWTERRISQMPKLAEGPPTFSKTCTRAADSCRPSARKAAAVSA